jgi:hypothetical protein
MHMRNVLLAHALAGGAALANSPMLLFPGAPAGISGINQLAGGTCDIGTTECNGGCMPIGSACCDSGGYCDIGDACTSDGNCCPVR